MLLRTDARLDADELDIHEIDTTLIRIAVGTELHPADNMSIRDRPARIAQLEYLCPTHSGTTTPSNSRDDTVVTHPRYVPCQS